LWLSHAFVVTLRCKASYIKCALDFTGKKANLHLPLLNIFGGCAMLGLCTNPFPGVLPDTKESLTMLFPFSRPKSATEMAFLEADFS